MMMMMMSPLAAHGLNPPLSLLLALLVIIMQCYDDNDSDVSDVDNDVDNDDDNDDDDDLDE